MIICLLYTILFLNPSTCQARRQGGGHATPPPPHPKSQNSPPDGIVKDLKWYKTNMVVVGLTVWRPQLSNFFRGACPRTSLKPLKSVQLSQITRDCPDSSWESQIPTRLQSGHGEYPDFEDQLSQANEQRNIFLLNYHNICHKMNKQFNLDIQVNSELQSCWMTQEEQNKITNNARSKGFLAFQYFIIKHFAANSTTHLHLDTVRPRGEGWYSHILAIRVCAAGEGMVFKPFGLVKGKVFKLFGLV